MNRTYGVLALVLGLVVGVRVVTLAMGQGDDKSMIQATLRESLQASREGKPGGVLEALSNSFKFNENEAQGNFGTISKFIRNQKPDIEVTNQEPIVTGDEARITSPVRISTSLPILGDKTVRINDVVMVFKKETGREYLVFPVKKWRLASVQAPEMSVNTLAFE